MTTKHEESAKTIERQFKRLIKTDYVLGEGQELLAELLALRVAKKEQRAAALYRLALPRACERIKRTSFAGERFVDPPAEIATLVAEETYAALRPIAAALHKNQAAYPIRAGMRTLCIGQSDRDVPVLAEAMVKGLAEWPAKDVAVFIEYLLDLTSDYADEKKRIKATLTAALPRVLTRGDIPLTAPTRNALKRMKVVAGKATKAPKELPTTMQGALALLRECGVKLAKPKKPVPKGLPSMLAAFYAEVGAIEPDVTSAAKLDALRRSLAKRIPAEMEEGIPRKAFSPVESWVVFGRDGGGDFYFLDPKKHGELVFRFAHDEEVFYVAQTSLAAWVSYVGLADWADEHDLDEALRKLSDRDEKAATKAFREKGKK